MGSSAVFSDVSDRIGKCAARDVPILIWGERGTCKELVARAIHENSHRRHGPFVSINLASMPEEDAEVTLFGVPHAEAPQDGERSSCKLREADGGTILIEEISHAADSIPEKLARLAREKEFRLNQHEIIRSDVRIIATSSKDPSDMVKKGGKLYGLIGALHGVHLRIPALRERKDGILPLVRHFIREVAERYGLERKDLSPEAQEYLLRHEWPGNIRELETVIKRAMILSEGSKLEKRDLLSADIGSCSIDAFFEEKLKRYLSEMTQLRNCNLYDTVIEEVERSLLTLVLRETNGNQMKAARTLGINRNTLRSKVKAYKIRV